MSRPMKAHMPSLRNSAGGSFYPWSEQMLKFPSEFQRRSMRASRILLVGVIRDARRIGRQVVSSLLAGATAVAVLLPPSHIHLASHDHDKHDHDVSIEHSHWSSHGGASRIAIDDDDGRAIFVDHPALVRHARAAVVQPVADVIAVLAVTAPPTLARSAQRLAGNAPRDGPARDTPTLRGPPFVL